MDGVFGLRLRLLAIVAAAALAFVALIAAGALTTRRADRELSNIQEHYLPKVELGPKMSAQLDRLERGLQDAVSAHDLELLADTREQRDLLLQELAGARGAIEPAQADELRAAIDDYYAVARDVSRRLIAGETGEKLVESIARMQVGQKHVADLMNSAVAFDRRELSAAFAAVSRAEVTADNIRLVVGIVCLLAVLLLSLWIGRGVLRSLSTLIAGLKRFGQGDFAHPIPVTSTDEIGDVARQANQMAEGLRRLGEEQRTTSWLKTGQAGLGDEVRGELSVGEVAGRAVRYLARHMEAPAAALYARDSEGVLTLLAQYGLSGDDAGAAPVVGAGEGLLGEAARSTEIAVVTEPPPRYVRLRSGLGDASPRALVMVPLVHGGVVTDVLELALFREWSPAAAEFLQSIRETLAIALEVARARERMRQLFHEKELQAERLASQEESLRATNAELQDRESALVQKADELARASAYKSQFLANMSHELRTPLNAIIGFSELLFDGVIPPDADNFKESLGYVLTSGRHLLTLINDVLDLSKVEAGKLEFHPSPLALPQLVDELQGILRAIGDRKRIIIETALDPAVHQLTLDPARLKQVLYNFASNAIKFTPERGRIQIRAIPEGEEFVRFEVEDSGIGISPEDLKRLFVEFQQVGAETSRQGGTGLGLALTKRLVEAQGGSVGVQSTVGKGSVFHARLPRRAWPEMEEPATLPPVLRPNSRSILVVEDDVSDRQTLVDALVEEGYEVEVATTGARALARCTERRFDAITLDLLLPDTNGIEVLRRLRSDERTRDIPVVVVTLVAEPGAVTGFAVADVLCKPLDAPALFEALRHAGVPPGKVADVLVVDDDPNALELMSATLAQSGYRATCESDPAKALTQAAVAPPSAVVLDLMMPGMSGFEFLERFRQEPTCRAVPVIVWTAKDLTSREREFLHSSAQALAAKGGGVSSVIRELKTFIGESARPVALSA